MQIPNFKELSQNKSLVEIQNYFNAIRNEFYKFKESLFSQTVQEVYVRHLINKCKSSIREFIPAEIIWDSRTNRFEEETYTFHCQDKQVLDDFIGKLCEDANDEYENGLDYFDYTNY